MKIIFNNGIEQVISQQIAQHLNDNILKGCKDWQCFQDDNGVYFMVRLSEVACIVSTTHKGLK